MSSPSSERVGFRTIGYRNFSAEEAIGRIAAAGYDGVEVCLEHPGLEPEALDEARCAALAQIAADAGIVIATVSYHGDRDALDLRWKRAVRAVELTPAFGCDVLIINAPRPGPEAPSDLTAQFDRQLAAQIERAEACGVTLALEPEPGLLVHGCADMRALIDRMGSPALAVNLDVGHAFLTEDDLSAAIAMLGEHIVVAHFEDIAGGVHRHLVPGAGEMDLPRVLADLRAAGFAGWLTVDLFDIADTPDRAAHASLEYMRRLVET